MDYTKLREEFITDICGEEPDILKKLRRETILTQLHPRMLSSWHQGLFLNFLIKTTKSKQILEIGTYTGYSAICMGMALQTGEKLITIEKNKELEDIVNKYINLVNLKDKIDFIIGDALKIIPDLPDNIDMVFIDADKREYTDYYNLILPKIKTGGLIVADNVLWDNKIFSEPASNDYMTKGIIRFNNIIKTDDRIEKIILPVRDGLMLLRKA